NRGKIRLCCHQSAIFLGLRCCRTRKVALGRIMIDRRHMLALLTAASVAPPAFAQEMSRPTAFAFSFDGLDGHNIRLANYAGKPIMVVNTASQCGYTPQLGSLQQLWTRYRSRGLLIVGVPSNDFGGQEPGTPDEIMQTAHN